MRRLLFSAFVVLASSAAIAAGATGAFFSDTETSTGNTFAAGAIDLKVDNDSYYNGNKCTLFPATTTPAFYAWVGTAPFPEPGSPCETSFPASDLDNGLLFFNFTDIKPDDEGEDTISLHVENDAYACLDVSLTSNDDRSTNEPEGLVDAPEDPNNTWDGELAQNIQFFWWADDGDNVYEVGENAISNGVQSLYDLATSTPFSVALADPDNNIWDPLNPGPIPANQTRYIGKAWCFGDLSLTPVAAGAGVNPSVNPGVTCNGSSLGNETQTDAATLDVAFRAVQARHNSEFRCAETDPRIATITVTKEVVNNNGGNNVISDFQLFVDNGIVATPVTSGVPTNVAAGTYTVGETGISGYVASFPSLTDDCDSDGILSILDGEQKTCTLVNDDLPANITLIKNVINNNGGTAGPTQFGLRIDGALVQNNTSVAVTSNTPHTINEDGRVGYAFVSITGHAKCPAVLGGTATLNEGESITCTITNDDTSLLVESFGTGTCLGDIPGWDEDTGESCVNGTVAAAVGTNDNTASPDGGRFALIGNNGYICRAVNAAGMQNLVMKYYWRGDSDADPGENGSVQYYTGGTCASPTGLVTLASHPLTTTSWSAQQSINLPGALNNTTFFVRFSQGANAGTESFRVDGVDVSGIPL